MFKNVHVVCPVEHGCRDGCGLDWIVAIQFTENVFKFVIYHHFTHCCIRLCLLLIFARLQRSHAQVLLVANSNLVPRIYSLMNISTSFARMLLTESYSSLILTHSYSGDPSSSLLPEVRYSVGLHGVFVSRQVSENCLKIDHDRFFHINVLPDASYYLTLHNQHN